MLNLSRFFFGLLIITTLSCRKEQQSSLPFTENNKPDGILTIEPNTIDLGELNPGLSYSFAANITNKEKFPIRLQPPGVNCACSEVSISQRDIPPNQTIQLKGVLRSPLKTGTINYRILIVSEDPVGIETTLGLSGKVVPTLKVTPSELTLIPNSLFYCYGKFNLINKSLFKIGLIPDSKTLEFFDVVIDKKTLLSGETTELSIKTKSPTLQEQNFELILFTTHPVESQIVIPILIRPKNPVTCRPSSIRFGILSHKEINARNFPIIVEGQALSSLSLSNIIIPKAFDLISLPNVSSKSISISLKIKEGELGAINDYVKFFFNSNCAHSPKLIISVPVSGIIRGLK